MPNLTNIPPDTDEIEEDEIETVECADCGADLTDVANDEDYAIRSYDYRSGHGYGDWVRCIEHFRICGSCGDHEHENNMHSVRDRDEEVCGNCLMICDGCGDNVSSVNDEDYCHECSSGTGGGLMGYGRTHAVHWLGGPLPKDEKTGKHIGYYLGLELEISAEYNDRDGYRQVREWLANNMGGADRMDLKHDGSVDGYELASQPMTPDYFENVNWESFFDVLNDAHPSGEREPQGHGLHVHIGRVAFDRDDVAMAAFCYLIGQGDHLERIGRRAPTGYCEKVHKPASAAIVHRKGTRTAQGMRLRYAGTPVGRSAINLTSDHTIEIRAFRSTRKANELRDAVRLVYVAAEYIRYLRIGRKPCGPKALQWDAFTGWAKENYPFAYDSIAGKPTEGSNRRP